MGNISQHQVVNTHSVLKHPGVCWCNKAVDRLFVQDAPLLIVPSTKTDTHVKEGCHVDPAENLGRHYFTVRNHLCVLVAVTRGLTSTSILVPDQHQHSKNVTVLVFLQ